MITLTLILFAAAVSLLLGGTIKGLIDYYFEALYRRRLNAQNQFLKRQINARKQ